MSVWSCDQDSIELLQARVSALDAATLDQVEARLQVRRLKMMICDTHTLSHTHTHTHTHARTCTRAHTHAHTHTHTETHTGRETHTHTHTHTDTHTHTHLALGLRVLDGRLVLDDFIHLPQNALNDKHKRALNDRETLSSYTFIIRLQISFLLALSLGINTHALN